MGSGISIATVQAMTANGARGHAVEDTAAITLRFAGGALGTLTVSDAVPAPWSWEITSDEADMYPQRPENCYLLAGTTGSLAVPKLELWRYEGETGWSAPLTCERIQVTPEDPQVVQLRHFCRVIRSEEAPLITGIDATRTLAATLAIREAAATGQRIDLDCAKVGDISELPARIPAAAFSGSTRIHFMLNLPAPATMYRALLRHDPSYEGVFWLGVRTTGIFCRPTCRARTPKRENVEFFGAPSEALHAGYRPCMKCRPLDHGRKPPPMVEKLLLAVETEPGRRYRDAELSDMGIDPSTARRQFKRYCGMTFQAYHRARRMGLALLDIRKGKTVIDSQLDQGFESGSGFREAFTRIVGTAPSRAREVTVLRAKWLETPLGSMLALADDGGLHLLDFVDRRGLERALVTLQKRLRARVLPGEHHYLAQIERELAEYFSGKRRKFDTPVVLTGSPFQSAVWQALQTIPAGVTWSYAELAKKIGRPAAVRAVGRANGDNRLSIIVPCHRVIGADGALTGYGGGLARKQKLLDLERATVQST